MERFILLAAAKVVLVALMLFGAVAVHGDDLWVKSGADGQPQVQLYFFWSLTCPHCQKARPFVEAMPSTRPWVVVHSRELTRHPENADQYQSMAAQLGRDSAAVPALLFCGEMHLGWHQPETTGVMIEQRLDQCRARLLTGGETVNLTGDKVTLPVLGEIDLQNFSLPLLTMVIAGLDAFNPCAMFVLLFLLSLMAHQQSRHRMLLVGGIFVLFSGLMYFAFMAAWLNLFQLLGNLVWVTLAAGILAVLVGLINVKDFFALHQGVTLSIPESAKPDIYRRARAVLQACNLPTMIAATAFLAIAANFYELLCTAGFPMVYTRLLTLSHLTATEHYLYLALYNIIYVVPLFLIVLAFVGTTRARKLTERDGRLLKLLSGLMMLGLGGVLLSAPELLTNLTVAFALFGTAFLVTWVAAKVTP